MPLSSHFRQLMRGTLRWETDVMSPKYTCSSYPCPGTRVAWELLRYRANVLQENISFSGDRGAFVFLLHGASELP